MQRICPFIACKQICRHAHVNAHPDMQVDLQACRHAGMQACRHAGMQACRHAYADMHITHAHAHAHPYVDRADMHNTCTVPRGRSPYCGPTYAGPALSTFVDLKCTVSKEAYQSCHDMAMKDLRSTQNVPIRYRYHITACSLHRNKFKSNKR